MAGWESIEVGSNLGRRLEEGSTGPGDSVGLKKEFTGAGGGEPSDERPDWDLKVDGGGSGLRLATEIIIEWRNEGCFPPQLGVCRGYDGRHTLAGLRFERCDGAWACCRGSRTRSNGTRPGRIGHRCADRAKHTGRGHADRRQHNIFNQFFHFPHNQAASDSEPRR